MFQTTYKVYYLQRDCVHELNGDLFDRLRARLEDFAKEGKALDATNITDQRLLHALDADRTYIKYYC
ncbi:hypothetical protein HCA00_02405 [Listeria booriae]|uniref:hypothetical protein n=1 Tax=Listeria booriae TaxID=1552123 RepID=UPI00162796DB|nr:hypothetical protein [Listeria booriae]MBC1522659.1 hypothetical protein [Listeria booriae]MBC2256967.1 hypothetical protein [Listeria booriae]MBC6127637.1 hypothetical protein [Listeria booriae]